MAHSSLKQSKLFCGTNDALAKIKFPLKPGAGLLYPSRSATTLADLPPNEKPEQLVIIDGTWSQARTMLRDLTQLKSLPHYKLVPTQPGKYRIRLEPTDTSLSTVEAAVQALKEVEPDTQGPNDLLLAFDQMVQRQLDHPRVGREHYSEGPKSGSSLNIPRRLLANEDSIVVAYGETGYRAGNKPTNGTAKPGSSSLFQIDSRRLPLFWVAQRLGSSESIIDRKFARALVPQVRLTDTFLNHLELSPSHFDSPVSVERFREDWRSFIRDGDTVAVYSSGSIRLLENVQADFESCLSLKSINFDPSPQRRTLSRFIEENNLPCETLDPYYGRAGRRLANAVALVKYLRRIANAS